MNVVVVDKKEFATRDEYLTLKKLMKRVRKRIKIISPN